MVHRSTMKRLDRSQHTQDYTRRKPRHLSRWLLSLVIFFGVRLYFPVELSSSAYTTSSPLSGFICAGAAL